MATLVLTAAGNFIGGSLGAAFGAFAGQQIDSAIFGRGGGREGARLKELALTTSSYGQPIARHFGVMRVPGTIIWSTDLIESRQTSGGGKGKPKTTTFSYSASFAVALASRPIASVGRIWADGNLLRGAAGDLKTPGNLRIHRGFADQAPDPLIAASFGAGTPAFRDCAYAVFEDLQLGDFGNRIPALTFEIHADAGGEVWLDALVPGIAEESGGVALPNMLGFSDEGGPLQSLLSTLDRVYPLTSAAGPLAPIVRLVGSESAPAPRLPPLLAPGDGQDESTRQAGVRERAASEGPQPRALRYYDRERDHQAGVQRALGMAVPGREEVIELPATLDSDGARSLVNEMARRARWETERLTWEIAELDPGLIPGTQVTVPDLPGIWLVASWEWTDRGVALELRRVPPVSATGIAGDTGAVFPPPDVLPQQSILRAFELPWDGLGDLASPAIFAAASASAASWTGAALFVEQGTVLAPIGSIDRQRSAIGSLVSTLEPSSGIAFEPESALEIELLSEGLVFSGSSIEGLANGANRLLVGAEVLQFARAEQLAISRWRLGGLLRGRGGTEHHALAGHPVATGVVLLDDALHRLDPAQVPTVGATRIAAIGFGDEEPVFASLLTAGSSRSPLTPVHPRLERSPTGDWQLSWTRRARGQWRWDDFVETALVEEQESYQVGIGPIDQPVIEWQVAAPQLNLAAADVAAIASAHSGSPLWVRQIGTYGRSPPTLIASIA